MSTQLIRRAESIVEMIDCMAVDSVLIQHGVSWEEYEELLESVGEAGSLRISYDKGTLQIMSPSSKHENRAILIERMVDVLSFRRRIKVLFFGSTTIKKHRAQKGAEPDACFYVQTADAVGTKEQIDFNTDPPPDIVVEIDIHHESISKFPIYAALNVPEFWRYDEDRLIIYHLREGRYVESEASKSLPLLTSAVMTEFLARSPKEDQYDILLAFEEWLKTQPR
jgi:Uma2 family endonuclease